MLSFGLGINCSANFPGLLGKILGPVWDLLATRTGVTISGRPAAPTFSITNVSADGAPIKRIIMPAYVITKAIWDAVQKTAVTNHQVFGLLSDASYVVVDCDTGSEFRTLAAEVAPTIAITRAPSTAGLEGLMAGMKAAEAMTARTGHPLATVSDGSEPRYAHILRIDGKPVTVLTAMADLTIETTISASGAQDVLVVTQALSVADKVVDPVIPTDPVSPTDPVIPPASVVPGASSMTYDGATAFFAASHPTGPYADGSPWVSSGGKAISITAISPASASGVSRAKSGGGTTGSTIVNGAMLDPGKAPSGATLAERQAVNDGLTKGAPSQGYDSYVLTDGPPAVLMPRATSRSPASRRRIRAYTSCRA